MSTDTTHPWNSVCLRCGSNNEPASLKCWLCGSEDLRGSFRAAGFDRGSGAPASHKEETWYLTDEVAPPYRPPPHKFTTFVISMGALALFLVAIGMWSEAPGLSVLIIVVEVGAVLLVSASRQFKPINPSASRSRSSAGVRALGVVASLVAKLAFVIGVLAIFSVVAGVAVVIFLLIICSNMLIGR